MTTIVKAAALPRATIIVTAGWTATVFISARIVAAGFPALRRCIFGRGKIPSAARTTLGASTTTGALPSAAPAPASATATITAAVSPTIHTAIAAPICASAIILAGAFASAIGARRVVLRRIVMRRKILRRRGVRIRLALVAGVNILVRARWFATLKFFTMLAFSSVCFFMDIALVWSTFYLARMLMVSVFVMSLSLVMTRPTWLARARQRFSRKNIDGGVWRFFRVIQLVSHGHLHIRRACWRTERRGMRLLVPVVVVFQVFEYVADVQESVAIQSDVHESGLHARKDAGDFAFVDAADERELFFALDVDFD